MGFLRGGGQSEQQLCIMTRHASFCELLWTNHFRNSPGLGFYRVQHVSQREYVHARLFWNANLKLNSDSTRIYILLVVEVKSPRHIFLQVHIFMFFFLSIPPSFLLFWAVLIPLKHSTPFSAMFVYIHLPPNNLINARAPSSGPRLSLFSEVSYLLPYLDLTTC